MRTSRFACGSAVIVALATGASTPASAQDTTSDYINIGTYAISIPVNDTHRFIDQPSWFGMGWDGLWPYRSRYSRGLSFTVHDFSHTRTGTTNFPSGAVTGQQASELLMMTLLGTAVGIRATPGGAGSISVWAPAVSSISNTTRSGGPTPHAFRSSCGRRPDVGYIMRVPAGVDVVVNARFSAQLRGLVPWRRPAELSVRGTQLRNCRALALSAASEPFRRPFRFGRRRMDCRPGPPRCPRLRVARARCFRRHRAVARSRRFPSCPARRR